MMIFKMTLRYIYISIIYKYIYIYITGCHNITEAGLGAETILLTSINVDVRDGTTPHKKELSIPKC